ncbi:LOW QUALITY PROTEIN: transcription factor IIIB 90 kDa subunit-like [Ptychodera flava]|uniref:LOW QUALITY PROTEIN: transcription factor IIIB 90 kDa subunit-like n=1 Tax=Ptychodera flava TaxID=63121 RepID=UPI00396A87A2
MHLEARQLLGQYVSAEGGKAHSLGSSFHHGFGKESRAVTLQNGKRKIQALGAQLKLNQHCIDTAYNFFKMAVSKRLTRGRKTSHVVASCLYLVCRTEGTPHMLLDFSDILQVNVYVLGKTYLKLSTELHINLPAIDPCLYIARFAHKLEFQEKTHEVSMTALRLVSRMKRDWMHMGRRPSGLCGAALLVAARLHDFNRTQKEIIRVVKVCDATLRKRLTEFEETPSSQLTIDEFQKIDLEEEQDPPSFTQSRRKAKLAQLEEMNKLPELEEEVSSVQAEIEKALCKKSSKDNPEIPSVSSANETQELQEAQKFIDGEILQENTQSDSSVSLLNIKSNPDNSSKTLAAESDTNTAKTVSDSKHNTEQMKDPDLEFLIDGTFENTYFSGPRPSAFSLGLKETIEQCMMLPEDKPQEEESGELDLTGIDDSELDRFILSDEEVKVKTEIWTKENAEYLKLQKEKEEKEIRDRELGITKPEPKKKRKYKKKAAIQANTAGEAIEKMLQEKKISSKINYDVLRDLNREGSSSKDSKEENLTQGIQQSVKPITLTSLLSSQRNKSRISHESKIRSQTTKQSEEAGTAKRARLDSESAPSAIRVEDVVIESGPVDFEDTRTVEDEDELNAEYYEEEEPVSAVQLMAHAGLDHFQEDYDIDKLV